MDCSGIILRLSNKYNKTFHTLALMYILYPSIVYDHQHHHRIYQFPLIHCINIERSRYINTKNIIDFVEVLYTETKHCYWYEMTHHRKCYKLMEELVMCRW